MPLSICSLPSTSSTVFCSPLLLPSYGYRTLETRTGSPSNWRSRPNVATIRKSIPPYAYSSSSSTSSDSTTKLLTFLGKGGSGKTTAAVFAAQHYSMAGFKTCLVIQSQDPSAEHLLNCKIASSPTVLNENLSVVRMETTKIMLQPLDWLKRADSRLKLTQGVLEGVVGEALGVLPAMDSILGAFHLGLKTGILNEEKANYDIVIYDGMNTDETLRLFGAASKARLYLKYMKSLAERTEIGRVIGPSVLSLVDEAMKQSFRSHSAGNTSAEIWDALEKTLERWALRFSSSNSLKCFLTLDPASFVSINAAWRYWGCTIQAECGVSGAVGFGSPSLPAEEEIREKFAPLKVSFVPEIAMDKPLDWRLIMGERGSEVSRTFFSSVISGESSDILPVKIDVGTRSVRLFMPGFDKKDIKLYKYSGGEELLVEAGDQRRVINLPRQLHGKVSGAKFVGRDLVIQIGG